MLITFRIRYTIRVFCIFSLFIFNFSLKTQTPYKIVLPPFSGQSCLHCPHSVS